MAKIRDILTDPNYSSLDIETRRKLVSESEFAPVFNKIKSTQMQDKFLNDIPKLRTQALIKKGKFPNLNPLPNPAASTPPDAAGVRGVKKIHIGDEGTNTILDRNMVEQLPEPTKPNDPENWKNSLEETNAIINTFDTNIDRSILYKDGFRKSFKKPSARDQVMGNFISGTGSLLSTVGSILERSVSSKEITEKISGVELPKDIKTPDILSLTNIGKNLKNEGERLQQAWTPRRDLEPVDFSWRSLLDPEFYITTIPSALPTTLALVPPAIVGSLIGRGVGSRMMLGGVGRAIINSIGAAAMSRPLESAMESQGAYDEAIANGKTEDEANAMADSVYKQTLAFGGALDVAEFALAFSPIKFRPTHRLLKMAAIAAKPISVAGMEGFEERVQTFINQKEQNPNTKWVDFFDFKDPELNESTAVGMLFGVGMGGAGSVLPLLYNDIAATIPEGELKEAFVRDKAETNEEVALGKLAENPEGKKHIQARLERLQAVARGEVPLEEAIKFPEAPVETEQITQPEDIEQVQYIDDLVSGEDIVIAPAPEFVQGAASQAAGEKLITVPISQIEEMFKKDSLYIEPNKAGEFTSEGKPVEAPSVRIDNFGKATFITGAETFAALRDAGAETITIGIDMASSRVAKDIGLVERKKSTKKPKLLSETEKLVQENEALNAAIKKASEAAKTAYKAGRTDEGDIQRQKIKKFLGRGKKIKELKSLYNITDNDLKKISDKNPLLMENWEFKKYLDKVRERAQVVGFEKASRKLLMDAIRELDLKKVKNYQEAMSLPNVANMNAEQLLIFTEMLLPFQVGDQFLTTRQLELVDRTDIRGIKTIREAREKVAEKMNIPVEQLPETLSSSEMDRFKWDSILVNKNVFMELLVKETTADMIKGDIAFMEFEDKIVDLAKKTKRSRGLSKQLELIPQDELIVNYLEETNLENKAKLTEQMTPEEIELATAVELYFKDARDYLLQTGMMEKGLEGYFVHQRRPFLEAWKDNGILLGWLPALKEMVAEKLETFAEIGILAGRTGEILPLEKFFKYVLHRSGEITPSKNVVRSVLNYAHQFERKKSFDELLPKMMVFADIFTPSKLTRRGLEVETSLKQFVKEYLNNKKGRQTVRKFYDQGGVIDTAMRAIKTFTLMLDLGFNMLVQAGSAVGEQGAVYVGLGNKAYALGTTRMATKKGRAILKANQEFVGRSFWEEFIHPGKLVNERLSQLLFAGFHASNKLANEQFLLGSLTDAEWESGEISPERLAQMKLEMGRFRSIKGGKSVSGSTSFGGLATQYKSWAIPLMHTIVTDSIKLGKTLRRGEFKQALTQKETLEIYRIIGFTGAILTTGALIGMDDEDNMIGQFKAKAYRDGLSFLSALDPTVFSSIRAVGFLQDLSDSLKAIATLEEYGTEKFMRTVTPRAIKQLIPED